MAVGGFQDFEPLVRQPRQTAEPWRARSRNLKRPHAVYQDGDRLSCRTCGRYANTPKARRRFCRAKCPGGFTFPARRGCGSRPTAHDGKVLGHALFLHDGVYFCWSCGRYSTKYLLDLGERCKGVPPAGARTRRNRLRHGLHPLSGVALKGKRERVFALPVGGG